MSVAAERAEAVAERILFDAIGDLRASGSAKRRDLAELEDALNVAEARLAAATGEDVQDAAEDAWPALMRARREAREADPAALLEPIGLHEARHTCASRLIASGANAKAVQSILGHATIGMTFDTYGHLMPGGLDEAAAAANNYLVRALGGGRKRSGGVAWPRAAAARSPSWCASSGPTAVTKTSSNAALASSNADVSSPSLGGMQTAATSTSRGAWMRRSPAATVASSRSRNSWTSHAQALT